MTDDLHPDPLRRALAVAAQEVRPTPDLLHRVRRGGRRRVRRRRLLAGALAALLLAGGATGVVHLHRPPAVAPLTGVADLLLDQPTRGDLADDRDWLDEVLATYERTRDDSPVHGLGLTDRPAGEPHVTWAGTTPAGPAAAVVQRMWSRHDRPSAFIRFIGTDAAGQPESLGSDVFGPPQEPFGWASRAFLTGPDRDVLVVLDVGDEVEWSPQRVYHTDGYTRTDWRPVRFADGAGVVRVPPQRDRYAVAIRDGSGTYLTIGNLTDPEVVPHDPGLNWRTPPSAGSQPARFPVEPHGARLDQESHNLTCGNLGRGDRPFNLASATDWMAYGRTPAGELFVATDLKVGGDPVRTVVCIQPVDASTHPADGEVIQVYGDEVDPTAVLPVRVRLPGDRGWLVARKDAALSYLDDDGRWQPAGRHAALLPPGASRARVDDTEVPLG
ncbi:hypothetical protein AWW66_11045 [Micromonospora rosaria]|uniref:Uncharacterized protein n=1 Tax=Micromonospora rosaria TaxID=47874 RepID=A0A136PU54_9ACTN|nr:hypothetical protein [Micromonospora rosaria]KXK61968.1 hypothetical protein AWW66_11045 [Micromonospora rosaria]